MLAHILIIAGVGSALAVTSALSYLAGTRAVRQLRDDLAAVAENVIANAHECDTDRRRIEAIEDWSWDDEPEPEPTARDRYAAPLALPPAPDTHAAIEPPPHWARETATFDRIAARHPNILATEVWTPERELTAFTREQAERVREMAGADR